MLPDLKNRMLCGAVERHELLWRVATERIAELIPLLEALVPPVPGNTGT